MRLLARILFLFCTILFVSTIALLILQPRIPLQILNSTASSLLSSLTGKRIKIQGNYFITPGGWTILETESCAISIQDDDANTSAIKTASAMTRVHLFSLFHHKLVLDGFSLHGLDADITLAAVPIDNDPAELSRDISTIFDMEITGAIDVSDVTSRITREGSGPAPPLQINSAKGHITETYKGWLDIQGMLVGDRIKIHLTSDVKRENEQDKAITFKVNLAYKSMEGVIKGELNHLNDEPAIVCDIQLTGKHVHEALSLFSTTSSNNDPFSLQGQLWLTENKSKILVTELSPGTTNMVSSLTISNYHQDNPEYLLLLQAETVDLDLLQGWLGAPENRPETVSPLPTNNQDNPENQESSLHMLIPDNFAFDISLDNLIISNKTIKDIRLDSIISDSSQFQIPFTATFENADIAGHFSMENQDDVPTLAVDLTSAQWNIGKTLERLQLTKDIRFTMQDITIDGLAQGHSIDELISTFSFELIADNGHLTIKEPNSDSLLNVALQRTKLAGAKGKALALDLKGEVNDLPFTVSTTIMGQRSGKDNELTSAHIDQLLLLGDTRWQLAGNLPVPFNLQDFSLTSTLEGQTLDEFNELLDIELPQTNPYRAAATINAVAGGYELTDLTVRTGASSFAGELSINAKAEPPRLSIKLTSEKIQLADFTSVSFDKDKKEENSLNDGQDYESLRQLTDQELVESYDATISLKIKELFSGSDRLGGGLLRFTQTDGNLYLKPLHINLPKGNIDLTFIRKPVSGGYHYLINTQVDDLDYGIIARHLNPKADSRGNFNLRSSLYSASPDFENLLTNATGYIDFSVEPEKLRAGAIDLWAVNLLSFLTPVLIPKNESKINCAAGQFDIVHGMLTQRDLLIDTSKIQVTGDVMVDFNKGWINATLRPRPKRPQFYSMATPITINGDLENFKTGMVWGGVIGTTIRLATSYVVVPFQWVTQKRVPSDDREKCLQIIRERGDLVQDRPWDMH